MAARGFLGPPNLPLTATRIGIHLIVQTRLRHSNCQREELAGNEKIFRPPIQLGRMVTMRDFCTSDGGGLFAGGGALTEAWARYCDSAFLSRFARDLGAACA